VSSSPSSSLPAAARHPVVSVHSIRTHQESKMGHLARPWLTLVLGQDHISTGVDARLWLPSKGRYQHTESVISQRWMQPPMNQDDLVRQAIMALQTYQRREGYDPS
jgi:hypothetical protein